MTGFSPLIANEAGLFQDAGKPVPFGMYSANNPLGVALPLEVAFQLSASLSVSKGDALKFSTASDSTNGKLIKCSAQDDVVDAIAAQDATSTSTSLTNLLVYTPERGTRLFKVSFTPLIDDGALSSGSTTTALTALADGSSNDLRGGIVFCKELGESRLISANTYSSNVVTITVVEPWSRALTSSDTVRVVPFRIGTKALKLASSSTHQGISTTRGDQTGGKVRVHRLDMLRKIVVVTFDAA